MQVENAPSFTSERVLRQCRNASMSSNDPERLFMRSDVIGHAPFMAQEGALPAWKMPQAMPLHSADRAHPWDFALR
jgi:hypothetical protein